jgi:hypothetical protein
MGINLTITLIVGLASVVMLAGIIARGLYGERFYHSNRAKRDRIRRELEPWAYAYLAVAAYFCLCLVNLTLNC